MRNGKITDAGINEEVKPYDPVTGLCRKIEGSK